MHFNQIHTTTRVVCLLLHVYVKITLKTNASLKICLFFKIPEKKYIYILHNAATASKSFV